MLKRILLTTDAVGGVWRYSMELARGLAAEGCGIVLAVLGPSPGSPQRLEASAVPGLQLVATGLTLDWLAPTPQDLDFTAHVLAALARQARVDTVQLHAPALFGAADWPVPVIAVAHSCVGTWWRAVRGGALPDDLAWRAAATRAGLLHADVVVAPSASFAEALQECYEIERPIEVVLNGRTKLVGRATRRQQALCAGRLWDAGKNVAELDDAAGMVPWPVVAAGSTTGPDGMQVECRHLQLLGALDEDALAEEFARAAVFVSLSQYEPFGLAVLEAAQAGCALILSDIPTFQELWDGAAVFVAPGRAAVELDRFLGDTVLCARYGGLAAARAASFSAQRMVHRMLTLHQQALAHAPAVA